MINRIKLFSCIPQLIFIAGAIVPFVHIHAEPLRLLPDRAHEITVTTPEAGVMEVTTTGNDPFVYTSGIQEGHNFAEAPILSFEYFSLTGTSDIQVFLEPPVREDISVHADGLQRSEGWSEFSIDLTPALAKTTQNVTGLRIDFGRHSGRTVRIRNMQLRGKSKAEIAYEERKAAVKRRALEADQWLEEYLTTDFKSRIDSVSVGRGTVTVNGTVREDDRKNLVLIEILIHSDLSTIQDSRVVASLPAGSNPFSVVVPRGEASGNLFSRWAIALESSDADYTLLSRPRYADTVESQWDLAEEKPRNKKGLGAFAMSRPLADIEDLGVSAVTVNILLGWIMRAEPGAGRTEYAYDGRMWYTDDAAVARLNRTLGEAANRDLIVSAVILLGQAGENEEGTFNKIVSHPNAHPSGLYVMPDITSAQGVNAYAAAMNFLAERYSRPDKEFGRIHHWIMHNEVNSGWIWTNMGEATALSYMDAYHKSMRIAHLIARQYNPHARVYISLEHNWMNRHNDKCHRGREMLKRLLQFSHAEGDFNWSLAFHPYPESLGNPRTWEDKTATFDFDTPRITFKNIEVLDAWMKRPEARFRGETVRDIQFTEQGPNSPDYSDKSLNEQAASMAYLWKKMENIDSISMYHYHNWVDNRHEGGLRIGLRKYPDDADDPHGRKPIWYVYKALGAAEQEGAIEFALPIIGIDSWKEILGQPLD
jgi:hypothetical protein